MSRSITLNIPPEEFDNEQFVEQAIARKLGAKPFAYEINKRSIDARRNVHYVLQITVYDQDEPRATTFEPAYQSVHDKKEVHIVGAGPAGYFAALECLLLGLKPILFDRGKDVQQRRRDLRALQQEGIVNPDSNYCFGEGGAGTYSDGKLYTRSKKRGNLVNVLQVLVHHGANPDIMVDAHPHIGSNKLPKVVAQIRKTIEDYGGEIHFDAKLTNIIRENGEVKAIVINDQEEVSVNAVILATGHSARDIYQLLFDRKIDIAFKPFALGVRIEHPQALIDQIQYRRKQRGSLPAAAYKLTCQANSHGVFSFCMCPGGLIVPASTAPGELVLNGMSLSRRDSKYANSGLVVTTDEGDLDDHDQNNPFRGLDFQRKVERRVFQAGDGSQMAPAQRLEDFLNGKLSSSLPDTSYIPGIYAADMNDLLPAFVANALHSGLKQFGDKMRGYRTNEAILLATESRTSSPVKIPRDEHCQSTNTLGLFPCGEGAGYAGGIMSAAIDGQRVARAVKDFLN